MKILYAIQGTGNGHLNRAKILIPAFKNRLQLDILISGEDYEVDLPYPVRYKFKGLFYVFGKKGGIDYWTTIRKNNIFRFFKEIRKLKKENYDLIINDFEPVSAWAYYNTKTPVINISHQTSLLSNKVPAPKGFHFFKKLFLRWYAPFYDTYSFHYQSYDTNVFPPLIRKELVSISTKHKKNNFIVYLPSYNDKHIINILSKIEYIHWTIYSKRTKNSYKKNNIKVKPVSFETFSKDFLSCEGILTNAGFQTTSEALFLNKKLLVIPQKNQFEQKYNAEALKQMGISVLDKFNQNSIDKISHWIKNDTPKKINTISDPQAIVDLILNEYILYKEFICKI